MTVEVAGAIACLGMFGAGHFALRGLLAGVGWGLRGRLEWTVTALAMGAVLMPALVYALIWISGPLPVGLGQALVYASAVAGLLGCVQVAQKRGFTPSPACFAWQLATRLDLALLGACIVFAGLAIVLSVAWPVHLFDPVFHFAYKGKILFHEGLGTGAFTDLDGPVGRVMTHPSYPPLIPAMEVFASFPLGEFSAHAGRVMSALFVIAPAVWIASALEDRGRRAQFIGALLWLSLPVLYYYRLPHNDLDKAVVGLLLGPEGARGLFGGAGLRRVDGATLDACGDLPVAALLCGAAVYLGRAFTQRRDGLIAGVLLGGAVLAKNEGLAMLGVLLVAWGLCALVRRLKRTSDAALPALELPLATRPLGGRALAAAFGVALLLCLPYLTFKGQIPVIDESYPELMKPDTLWASLTTKRMYQGNMEPAPVTVGREYLLTFGDALRWNLIWPLFLAVLGASLVRFRTAFSRGALWPTLITLGALMLFFLILVVTPWHLGSLFRTGIPDRLFLQVAPLAALAIAAWVFAPQVERA